MVRALEREQQEFILIEGNTPLNSVFRESVLVQKQKAVKHLDNARYRDHDNYYEFYFQPDLDNLLSIRRPGTGLATTKDATETVTTNHTVGPDLTTAVIQESKWFFDHPLTLIGLDGNKSAMEIEVYDWISQPGFHWSTGNKSFKAGAKAYRISGLFVQGDTIPTVQFLNKTSKKLDVVFTLFLIDGSDNISLQIQFDGEVSASALLTAQPSNTQWGDFVAAAPDAKAFALSMSAAPDAGGAIDTELGNEATFALTFGKPWQFTGSTVWEKYSAFDLIDESSEQTQTALREQYRMASHSRVPIVSVTIKNATANIAKGGLVAACQVPGNATVDVLSYPPAQLFDFAASRLKRSSGQQTFERGFYAHTVPEKLQDVLFESIVGDELVKNSWTAGKPKILVVINNPDAAGSIPNISLEIRIHYEFLTSDKSCPLFKCPGNALLQLEAKVAALNSMPQFWENPTHVERLKNAIKGVIKSPTFRKIAKDVAIHGMELLLA